MSADLAAAVATWLEKRRAYVLAAVGGPGDTNVALAKLGDADEALADAYRDLNTWPRTWRLPTVPDDLKLATTPDGRVYERDVERPDRWYLVYGNGARTGAWLRLGQLLDLAGPDGIREAVPE